MVSRWTEFRDALSYEEMVQSVYDSLVDKSIGTVFLHKKYAGKRTGHEHDIDISIEVSVAELHIVILVECKNYNRTVDVGDVLTLAQRIDDIGAHKGVMVSTIGFQEGARKVAKAHGIALVVTEPIWQVIMHSRDSQGQSQAFCTTGRLVIGGEGDSESLLFRGVTTVVLNYAVNLEMGFQDAWVSLIKFLTADCDTDQRKLFLMRTLQNQFTDVCPFCGESLRTRRARQCRHCGKDWHDLSKVII